MDVILSTRKQKEVLPIKVGVNMRGILGKRVTAGDMEEMFQAVCPFIIASKYGN